MNSYRRTIGVLAASAVFTATFVGVSGVAEARTDQPAPSAASQQDLLGLLELLPLDLPVLSGLGSIDSLLSITQPIWNLPGVTTDITWLRDGIPIPGTEGLWDYVPTSLDGGHDISAQVTGTLLGLLPVTLLTNALGISLPGTDPTATTPTATTPPRITGEPKVGKILTAVAPTWSLDGVTNAYQWLRAGATIPGATASTYTVSTDDVGKAISFRATGSKPNTTPATATSAPVTGLLSDAPTVTTPASITGAARVGSTLTVTAPGWSTTGVVTTYQWLLDTVAIPGAVATTYDVTAQDVGKAISVRATGTKPGLTPATTTSAPVTGLLGETLVASTPPSISGSGRTGQVLTVNPGTWGPLSPTTWSYQWLRNGVAVPGATDSTYIVPVRDAAKSLSVEVTAAREGYSPGRATTAGVAIAKLASTTRAGLAKKKIAQGTTGLLRVTLGVAGLVPAGRVKVYDGARLLKTYTVRAADNGSRVFKLPKLQPGRHKLKVAYAGSSSINGSTSKVVTLRVLKRH